MSVVSSLPVLLTPEQAAEALGATRGTLNVWRCTRRYPLPNVEIGRNVRYRADDVARFIRSRTMGEEQ